MTTAFKQQILNDARATFLNPLEFSDGHRIDGKIIVSQVDKDEFNRRAAKLEGVFSHGIVVYLNKDDLPREPVPKQRMQVDGVYYYVIDVQDEYGVLIITLEANEL